MEKKVRTPAQNKLLHSLLTKLNLSDMKKSFCLQYSNQRTEKSSELTYDECASLLLDLQKNIATRTKQNDSEEVTKLKRKRGKILHLAIQAGFHDGNGNVDYARFNKFMVEKSCEKKMLKLYSLTELDKLITQFEQIAKFYNSKKV